MADDDYIAELLRELGRVIASVFYITENLKEGSHEFFPLWVSVKHGLATLEKLDEFIEFSNEKEVRDEIH